MWPENEAINVLTVSQSKAPVLVSVCIIYKHAQCCEDGMKAEAVQCKDGMKATIALPDY